MQKHILSNGFTFLAVTTGHYGTWARATDPITAARNAANAYSPSAKVAVQVFLGKADDLTVGAMGGVMWVNAPPIPIGLFLVSKSSIKPMPKGAFNPDHESHDEWMTAMIDEADEATTRADADVA